MSHNVLIANVKITSLDALRRAISELQQQGINVSLLEQNRFRTYRGQDPTCDLCISLPDGRYDVGLKLQADGSYVPVCDASGMPQNGTGISCAWQQGDVYASYDRRAIGKLMQHYAVCVAEDSLQLSGYVSTREIGADGNIYVVAETN